MKKYLLIAVIILSTPLIANGFGSLTFNPEGVELIENGESVDITINLTEQPGADVIVSFIVGEVGIGSSITLDKESLTFTSENWNIPQTVTATAINDSSYDGNRSLSIGYSFSSADALYNTGLSPNTIYVSITEDDPLPAPKVTLTSSETELDETGGIARLGVLLSEATSEDVTVELSLSGSALGNGVDYSTSSMSVTVVAGQTQSNEISITGVDDNLFEDYETIVVNILSISGGGATEDTHQEITITMASNESAPIITLSSNTSSIRESGEAVVLTANLSNPSFQNISLDLSLSGGAVGNGIDYSISTSSIDIPAGLISGSTTITTIADSVYEGTKNILIGISTSTSGEATINMQEVSLNIIDDENPPSSSGSRSIYYNNGAYLNLIYATNPSTIPKTATASPNIKIQNGGVTFTREFGIGTNTEEVLTLQRFLNSKWFIVSLYGPGSIGNETSYFGSKTRNALIRFQKMNGISGTGYFGPITKNFINNL